MPVQKQKTDRYINIHAPKKAVGLWSHHAEFTSTLHPIEPTRQTMGRCFNDDLVRHETYAEALEMMRAKGWSKSPTKKMMEYAAQYLGEKMDGHPFFDRVFKDDHRSRADTKRNEDAGKPLAEVLSLALAAEAEKVFSERIEADQLSDAKTSKFFTLESPIVIGNEFKAMVAREFRRVAYTGTMGWRRQIVRPAHEVALGIWLARLLSKQV